MSHRAGDTQGERLATFTMRGKFLRFKFDIGDLVIFQKPGMTVENWASGISDEPYITAIILHREVRAEADPINIYQAHGCDGRKHYELREKKLALVAKTNP